MSDLQVALIAVGAAVVAGVWGFNKWQESRQRKLAEKVFRGNQADALFGASSPTEPPTPPRATVEPRIEARTEPVLTTPATPVVADATETADEVQIADAAEITDAEKTLTAPARSLPPLPEQWADEVADCVIRIDFAEPVPAPSLWAAQSFLAPHVGKRLVWVGYNERQNHWMRLSAEDAGRYDVVCASLQLVDRRGAVPDTELSVFLDGVRQIAQQFGGTTELPEREAVAMHARALDDFCAGVDVQLGVNVIGVEGNAFPGARLNELARAAGLTLDGEGFFRASDEAGRTLFTLGNLGAEGFHAVAMESLATQGVTLSLDVPRVGDGPAALDRLLIVAHQLSEGLDGIMVDGQGHPLSADMIDSIRGKVAELQTAMAQRQVTAGSARALRLFS